MTDKEAYESLKLKFTSGNEYEVERATILRTEWDAIKTILWRHVGVNNSELNAGPYEGNNKRT